MPNAPERVWQSIAESELVRPDVTAGTGFGRSEGLRVSGKIFAMLVKDELVVKLPKARVEELTVLGDARRFDPGHGRLMKEWATVRPSTAERWRALVEEARAFVGSG
ncbi:MAG: hypothetical protein ACRDWI_04620 [Jiangellaceae bacterium]